MTWTTPLQAHADLSDVAGGAGGDGSWRCAQQACSLTRRHGTHCVRRMWYPTLRRRASCDERDACDGHSASRCDAVHVATVMGDEAELGPALKGSVPTLDSVENWLLFESPAGARYASFRRTQAQRPSFASSPGHSVSKRILRSWCHIFHCVARRAHRASCTSRATTTAALGAQGLAPEYDLLQLTKLPHSGASVAFVAPCRRAALWLEEGLVSMPDRCAQVGARCANLAKRACRAGGDVRLGRIAALRAR